MWNDCVIVPGLGGFTASHVTARFDEDDNTFIPPLRTLGFNPKLNINDSLLAQSYTEAYDISYPEAIKRIADDVEELRQHLDNDGSYTLNDIGTLCLMPNGSIGFTPCEAGVLTPSLYSLSSFEMCRLNTSTSVGAQKEDSHVSVAQRQNAVEMTTAPLKTTEDNVEEDVLEDEEDGKAIRIKLSVLRNIAAVLIAVVGFFALSTPVDNSRSTVQMSQMEYGIVSKLLDTYKKDVKTPAETKLNVAATGNKQDVTSSKDDAKAEAVNKSDCHDYFCIVLASRVTKKNAEAFVARLATDGHKEARVLTETGHATKVVYGSYATQTEAYNALNRLSGDETFHDAWVYNVK